MKIYLLTLPNGSFSNSSQSWSKLDLTKVRAELDFPIIVKTILEIDDLDIGKNDIIIYSSSSHSSIRSYLKDKLYYFQNSNLLIPNYELLMAHENKGFQEVMKNFKAFGNLTGSYIYDLDDHTLPLPKVMKTCSGAGSSGVFLVKTNHDITNLKNKYSKTSLKRKLISTQRKIKLSSAAFNIYKYNKKNFNLFVEQEFIPDLKHDFKVLVFGDRYFVLKRLVRNNDFRASGSGKFEFIEPPKEVLNFAKQISDILDNPYLSLDIAQSEKGCHLIEFQATNFGPYTLINAPNRYVHENNNWSIEKNDKDLESNYAYALNYFINKKMKNI